ncbi:carbohydrate-binding protein, partial [Nonomuraea sp. MG754425]|nr:carbohydrate-binding protein [Nonomuraea sp. MG754425]
MRLRGPAALLAAALIALHATPASAANLVVNPGFESGLTGWTCSGAQAVSSPVHGGAGAVRATP